ncbi:putative mrf1 mitochondrial n(5)-glutamine methyltransferase [Botrytis fragariae]|uniref:peptide chain release factor N(5)-glutamine methyltransferase n=1 Tax=Botrytis fragariae TaxID=1964551 RepID=A0A8H6B4M3_9HELO|nr:putative mrf1 mitochondrial n(5)-glutamine methyltransferase [Botrytis fragariae]KAF5879338.1 putative mrf1 mitochondrial n(5)-glutamine methyltransferase [Botrytis fragariae]
MPRLSHALLRRAYNISPLLPLVLRETRSLSSAINELRWLREYVDKTMSHRVPNQKWRTLLKLCQRRATGEPLQYILGTQPFGELEIKCKPGVLIPRPETEAYTTHLAELLIKAQRSFHETSENQHNPLKIVDFCSGTGCISLLLYSLLHQVYPRLEIVGLDISKKALDLSIQNVRFNSLNRSAQQSVHFEFADVLSDEKLILGIFQGVCDVIVSNPPYISEDGFNKETTRSVRNWEPKIALVPDTSRRETIHFNDTSGKSSLLKVEDIFYHQLLRFHSLLKSKILVMEIELKYGGTGQINTSLETRVQNACFWTITKYVFLLFQTWQARMAFHSETAINILPMAP